MIISMSIDFNMPSIGNSPESIRFLIIGPEDIDQRNCIIRGEKKTPKCIYKKKMIFNG